MAAGAAVVVKRVSGNTESVQAVETREVFKTTDYDRFTFDTTNRVISNANIKQKIESLSLYGFRKDSPIHVVKGENGKLKITEGQHRFLAAKELAIPIYYIFKTDSDVATDIRIMHAYSTPWTLPDYVGHFCAQGFPHYITLRDFCDEHQIPYALGVGVLMFGTLGGGSATRSNTLRTGGFEVDEASLKRGREILRMVNDVRFLDKRIEKIAKNRTFLAALAIMCSSKHYDHERFMGCASRQITAFVSCHSVAAFLEMLSEIFNFKKRVTNRFVFTQRGSRHQEVVTGEFDDGADGDADE